MSRVFYFNGIGPEFSYTLQPHLFPVAPTSIKVISAKLGAANENDVFIKSGVALGTDNGIQYDTSTIQGILAVIPAGETKYEAPRELPFAITVQSKFSRNIGNSTPGTITFYLSDQFDDPVEADVSFMCIFS